MGRRVGCLVSIVGVAVGVYLVVVGYCDAFGHLCYEEYDQIGQGTPLFTCGLVVGFASFFCGIFCLPGLLASGAKLLECKTGDAAESGTESASSFMRQGGDTHCKKGGFKLIGPGGPCRKCDDVTTRPCSSCGLHILTNDMTCPYCGTGVK